MKRKRVHYTRSGRIIVHLGDRSYRFRPEQRERAYALIRLNFGRKLGKHLVRRLREILD